MHMHRWMYISPLRFNDLGLGLWGSYNFVAFHWFSLIQVYFIDIFNDFRLNFSALQNDNFRNSCLHGTLRLCRSKWLLETLMSERYAGITPPEGTPFRVSSVHGILDYVVQSDWWRNSSPHGMLGLRPRKWSLENSSPHGMLGLRRLNWQRAKQLPAWYARITASKMTTWDAAVCMVC